MANYEIDRMTCDPRDAIDLICKIPAVQACQIIPEEDQFREVHILADDSRAPKQIARDVQSALLAQFGMAIDHRIISIAQIPCAFEADKKVELPPPMRPARLLCNRLQIVMDKRELEVNVTLALGDRSSEASARGYCSPQERRRIIAEATMASIAPFLKEDTLLRIGDVADTQLGGRRVILVAVTLTVGTDSEYLVGAAYERDDRDLSVVSAALDAINRRLRF